ncbi:MAG TPA: hypothetical protein VK177_12760 [Flavobacteriales bacterium]|nr:hypothetical protein [Flavobacteriales bacterium]
MNWSIASYCARIYAATAIIAPIFILIFLNSSGETEGIGQPDLLVYIFYYLASICTGVLFMLPAFVLLSIVASITSIYVKHVKWFKGIIAGSIFLLLFFSALTIRQMPLVFTNASEHPFIYMAVASVFSFSFTVYQAE